MRSKLALSLVVALAVMMTAGCNKKLSEVYTMAPPTKYPIQVSPTPSTQEQMKEWAEGKTDTSASQPPSVPELTLKIAETMVEWANEDPQGFLATPSAEKGLDRAALDANLPRLFKGKFVNDTAPESVESEMALRWDARETERRMLEQDIAHAKAAHNKARVEYLRNSLEEMPTRAQVRLGIVKDIAVAKDRQGVLDMARVEVKRRLYAACK